MKEAIEKARVGQELLNLATDQLNRSLIEAETAIAALKLGVAAQVAFPDGERWLSFKKHDQKWRLIILHNDDEYTPLINATRQDRVQAVALLQPLVKQLCSNVQAEIERVERAVDATADFVGGLK